MPSSHHMTAPERSESHSEGAQALQERGPANNFGQTNKHPCTQETSHNVICRWSDHGQAPKAMLLVRPLYRNDNQPYCIL